MKVITDEDIAMYRAVAKQNEDDRRAPAAVPPDEDNPYLNLRQKYEEEEKARRAAPRHRTRTTLTSSPARNLMRKKRRDVLRHRTRTARTTRIWSSGTNPMRRKKRVALTRIHKGCS
jgi:hypothetical protein